MNHQNPDVPDEHEDIALPDEKSAHTAEKPTLSDVLQIYERAASARSLSTSTIRSTRLFLRTISRYIPDRTALDSITEDRYYDMVIRMRESGLKEGTIKTYSDCLRKLFRLAHSRGIIKTNFFSRVYPARAGCRSGNENGISRRLITRCEFRSLSDLLKCDMKYLMLYSLLYYSGIRIGEALALSRSDIRACSGADGNRIVQITVNKTLIERDGEPVIRHDTKNHKSRSVPLPDAVRGLYSDYLAYLRDSGEEPADDDRLFPMSYYSAYSKLLTCCRKAGIRRHTPHDFRHTYISNLISAGLPVSSAAYFSGDTESVIMNTYIHVTEDYQTRLLDALKSF